MTTDRVQLSTRLQQRRRSRGLRFAGMLFCVCTFGTVAAELPTPLIQLPFDSDLKGSAASAVKLKPSRIGEVRLTDGLVNSGVEVGEGGMEYTFAEPLRLPTGSVLLWFCPCGWDDVSYIELLMAYKTAGRSRQPALRLYVVPHHWRGLMALRYLTDTQRISVYANRVYVEHWRRQKEHWHQAVFTWDQSQGTLYVDGLEVDADPDIGREMDGWKLLRVGGKNVRYPEGGGRVRTKIKTVLDEVRIYDQLLTPEQVRQDYESHMGPLVDTDDF